MEEERRAIELTRLTRYEKVIMQLRDYASDPIVRNLCAAALGNGDLPVILVNFAVGDIYLTDDGLQVEITSVLGSRVEGREVMASPMGKLSTGPIHTFKMNGGASTCLRCLHGGLRKRVSGTASFADGQR